MTVPNTSVVLFVYLSLPVSLSCPNVNIPFLTDAILSSHSIFISLCRLNLCFVCFCSFLYPFKFIPPIMSPFSPSLPKCMPNPTPSMPPL
ncbi:hypothetical protein QBC45DRAFT_401453 [Copromyces sp. CBS 386.78]|nr:hypothetical protein QBC45DRAFT_401453 [Copromyces sp. CBS 386.78]